MPFLNVRGGFEMYRVAKALQDDSYEGVNDSDHIMRLSTDDSTGRGYP
jgi:hypothetical protein